MNKFEKVSYAQFEDAEWNTLNHEPGESCSPDYVFALQKFYENLNLPKRATKGSAGYDFFAPYSFDLEPGESVKIATGIRVQLDDDKFLALYPRSGLGFKFRIQLDNTVGDIDSDYYNSDNEGHIMAKITNDGREGKAVHVKQGEAFMQGVITQFFKTVDDESEAVRNGGFGSTTPNA